ncbi:MAG: TetR/AcrR family transcriptional regulator [Rhodomicrobiaceae bacterium]
MSKLAARKQRNRRGSEDVWLDAAYEALIEGGIEAVKVMPLAENLDVSRTSFYWHFDDREALLNALIEKWKEKNTGNLVRQTQLFAETITEAVLNLFDCWIDPELFDARLDFAMRSWAQGSPELKSTFEEADAERIEAICAMFARFGFDAYHAHIRANTIYLTQIGYISMKADEPLPERIRHMPAYVETVTGRTPSQSEIERFMARHQERLAGE